MLERQLSDWSKTSACRRNYFPVDSQIEERQRILRERVDEAIRAGKFWQIVMAEFMRDYSSLFDNILRAERRIDLDFNAQAGGGSASLSQTGRGVDKSAT